MAKVLTLCFSALLCNTAMGACSGYGEKKMATDIAGDMVETIFDMSTDDLCCAECDKYKKCTAWVWYQKICYLKTYQGTFPGKPGGVARIKKESPPPAGVCSHYGEKQAGKDIAGDMVAIIPGIQNNDYCCAQCDKHANCSAWVWDEQICYLKTFRGIYTGKPSGVACIKKKGPAPPSPPSPPAPPTPSPPSPGTCSKYGEKQADKDIGGEIVATIKGQATDDLCCPECDQRANCAAWVWYQQTCYLKGNIHPTHHTLPGSVLRVKSTAPPLHPCTTGPCCNPHSAVAQFCPGNIACTECGGGDACQCPHGVVV